jgi:hypothetical protein
MDCSPSVGAQVKCHTYKVAAVAIGVSEANWKPLLFIHRLSFYPSCSRLDLNLTKFERKNYIILFTSLKI